LNVILALASTLKEKERGVQLPHCLPNPSPTSYCLVLLHCCPYLALQSWFTLPSDFTKGCQKEDPCIDA
jgi:hypothetical protein